MRALRDMTTIQIEITNACNKCCSNCTRFCGHHKKSFFMNYETFTRSVDSLDGYQGTIGIMGGEPTLHPQFERFVRFIAAKFGKNPATQRLVYPLKDFIKAQQRRDYESFRTVDDTFKAVGPGLWSNMGASYKKHYEIINDTFFVQILNDHINPIYHQPGLVARKDLGISDADFFKLRDKCWVQNEWSASITPKGAFFCEIAAALDMLFDGPGGWLIEPGWWKREPKDFGDQLHWCELCGFALDTFMRDGTEEIDDVSETLYEKLKNIESSKLKSGRVNLIKVENGQIAEESKLENKRFSAAMPYAEKWEDRFNAMNSVLFASKYDIVDIENSEDFGIKLNKLLDKLGEWIVAKHPDVQLVDDFCERMSKYVLNPGTMHWLDLSKSNDMEFVKSAGNNNGFVAMFNKNALSLREFGYDRIAHVKSIYEIIAMWQPNKVIELSSAINKSLGLRSRIKSGRYAIWGTGMAGNHAVDAIQCAGAVLVCAVDRNCAKHGKDFNGMPIQTPEYLLQHSDEFDWLIAANYTHYEEIKREAIDLGIDKNKVLRITDI